MTVVIIFACILILLLVLALLRVGVGIKYEEVFFVSAKVAFLKFSIYPRKRKKKKHSHVEKTHVSEETTTKGDSAEQNKIEKFFNMVDPILKAVGRLRRKLSVNCLTLHVTVGAPDPFEAAMKFGKISASIGALTPVFENTLNIKKRNISTDIDFQAEEDKIFFFIDLSISVWEIIYVVCALVPLMAINKPTKEIGEVKNNGQASHK